MNNADYMGEQRKFFAQYHIPNDDPRVVQLFQSYQPAFTTLLRLNNTEALKLLRLSYLTALADLNSIPTPVVPRTYCAVKPDT